MKKLSLKILSIGFFAISFAVLFSTQASAYIDPSIMTFAVQAIAGVVIAVGAVVGVLWRKSKKKISKVLNIDENRNKEVESDEIIVNSKKSK